MTNFAETITSEQRAALLRKSDLQGFLALGRSLALAAGAFVVAGLWPNPATIVLAVLLLGSAQIGLAVLMHDAAHRTLFRTRWLNDWVGRWLCAEPIGQSLTGYRKYHMAHHRYGGSDQDPDAHLTRAYPVSKASMTRKVLRDLTGVTGVKLYFAVFLMQAGYYKYQLNGKLERAPRPARPWVDYPVTLVRNLWPMLLVHGLLFGLFWIMGKPWLFALWWGALLSTFQLILRLRQIGDHGMVPDRSNPDPMMHTRTTDVRWWERILLVPHNVNYHLEHHLLPAAPSQSLPAVRQLLLQQHELPEGTYQSSFLSVLKLSVR